MKASSSFARSWVNETKWRRARVPGSLRFETQTQGNHPQCVVHTAEKNTTEDGSMCDLVAALEHMKVNVDHGSSWNGVAVVFVRRLAHSWDDTTENSQYVRCSWSPGKYESKPRSRSMLEWSCGCLHEALYSVQAERAILYESRNTLEWMQITAQIGVELRLSSWGAAW